MGNKRITDVSYLDSLNNNESFFVNRGNTLKQINVSDIRVGMKQGGTGSRQLVNAPANAIIRKVDGDSSDYLWYTPTNNGALYATKENGYPQFGTLPIAQGGTGSTTKAGALSTLGAMSASDPVGTGSFSMNRKSGSTVGKYSHAEGYGNTASATTTHAEGSNTTASGISSHAEGVGTIAASYRQHVQGAYNISDSAGKYIHIVGNGTSTTARSNAHTLTPSGDAWYAGDMSIGGAIILSDSAYGSSLPSSAVKGQLFFKIVDDSE